jgi:hypothetical protein
MRRAMYPVKFAGLHFLLLLCAVVVVGIDVSAVRAFDAMARAPVHPWCVKHEGSAGPTTCEYDNFLTCGMAAIVAGGSCKKRLRSSITEGAVPLPRPHKLSAGKRSKSIRQNDAQSAPQRPHGSTRQVDGSTDTIAASPPAFAKPIEQSDVAWVTQQQQGGTLSNPTDAVAASPSVAAKPIEQSDAASVSQPQESTLSKPTDAVAASASAAAKLIEQSDADSVTRQPQENTSKPADAVAASPSAAANLLSRVTPPRLHNPNNKGADHPIRRKPSRHPRPLLQRSG